MKQFQKKNRKGLSKIYSQDLINNLFNYPYTKIDFLVNDLQVTRKTAAKYLQLLCEAGFFTKMKLGKESYYLNNDLYNLLSNVSKL